MKLKKSLLELMLAATIGLTSCSKKEEDNYYEKIPLPYLNKATVQQYDLYGKKIAVEGLPTDINIKRSEFTIKDKYNKNFDYSINILGNINSYENQDFLQALINEVKDGDDEKIKVYGRILKGEDVTIVPELVEIEGNLYSLR